MENHKARLKDIINVFTDKEIVPRLLELYPEEKKNEEGYYKALKELRGIKNKLSRIWKIKIELVDDESGNYENVVGYKNKERLAIEFNDWSDWLGYKIDNRTLKRLGYLDIVCHCLWEMTWHGYTNDEVKVETDEILGTCKKAIKEIEKDIKEKRKERKG